MNENEQNIAQSDCDKQGYVGKLVLSLEKQQQDNSGDLEVFTTCKNSNYCLINADIDSMQDLLRQIRIHFVKAGVWTCSEAQTDTWHSQNVDTFGSCADACNQQVVQVNNHFDNQVFDEENQVGGILGNQQQSQFQNEQSDVNFWGDKQLQNSCVQNNSEEVQDSCLSEDVQGVDQCKVNDLIMIAMGTNSQDQISSENCVDSQNNQQILNEQTQSGFDANNRIQKSVSEQLYNSENLTANLPLQQEKKILDVQHNQIVEDMIDLLLKPRNLCSDNQVLNNFSRKGSQQNSNENLNFTSQSTSKRTRQFQNFSSPAKFETNKEYGQTVEDLRNRFQSCARPDDIIQYGNNSSQIYGQDKKFLQESEQVRDGDEWWNSDSDNEQTGYTGNKNNNNKNLNTTNNQYQFRRQQSGSRSNLTQENLMRNQLEVISGNSGQNQNSGDDLWHMVPGNCDSCDDKVKPYGLDSYDKIRNQTSQRFSSVASSSRFVQKQLRNNLRSYRDDGSRSFNRCQDVERSQQQYKPRQNLNGSSSRQDKDSGYKSNTATTGNSIQSNKFIKYSLYKEINWKSYTYYMQHKDEFDYWRTIGRSKLRGQEHNFPKTHSQEVFEKSFNSAEKVPQAVFLEVMGLVMYKVDSDEVKGALNLTCRALNEKIKGSVEVLQFKESDVMDDKQRIQCIMKVVEKYSTSAHSLDLSNLSPDLTNELLAHILNRRMASSEKGYQEVTELHLRNCHRLHGSGVATWAQLCLTSVTFLDISGCWLMNHEGIESLLDAGVLPKSFIFRDSYISVQTLELLVTQNTNLEELDISNPRVLAGQDLNVLVAAADRLRILRVQCKEQKFTPSSLECLARLINLEVLDLPQVVLTDDDSSQAYLNCLLHLFQSLLKLQQVNLMCAPYKGLRGEMLPENLKKFVVVSPDGDLLADILQGKSCFSNLQSLTIPPTLFRGELQQVGLLPDLLELKFFNIKSLSVDWRSVSSVICVAPQLQKISFQNCKLQEWECGLGYDSFKSVRQVELINCGNITVEEFQHLYCIFGGMKKLRLQDMELPNNFLDSVSVNLEHLDLYFVRNVDQEQIMSMRGCKPSITHSHRQRDLPPPYNQLRQLETIIVREQGNKLGQKELESLILDYGIHPRQNMFITGIIRSLGGVVRVRYFKNGYHLFWKFGGRLLIDKIQGAHFYSVDPLLSREEQKVLSDRRQHIRFLRTHVKHPREHLEYDYIYHNL